MENETYNVEHLASQSFLSVCIKADPKLLRAKSQLSLWASQVSPSTEQAESLLFNHTPRHFCAGAVPARSQSGRISLAAERSLWNHRHEQGSEQDAQDLVEVLLKAKGTRCTQLEGVGEKKCRGPAGVRKGAGGMILANIALGREGQRNCRWGETGEEEELDPGIITLQRQQKYVAKYAEPRS